VLNKVNALKVMAKHRDVIDIQQGGEHGRTALHLSAIHDHDECARVLVSCLLEIVSIFIKFLWDKCEIFMREEF
jgi:hypothetical protein